MDSNPAVTRYAREVDSLLAKSDQTSCRGVYDLLKSLSKEKDVAVQQAVCSTIARRLVDYFVSSDKPQAMRRWVGLLLERCVSLLRGDDVRRMSTIYGAAIGKIVEEEREDLRLVAGKIIRTIALAGIAWTESFQDFVDDLHEKTQHKSSSDSELFYAMGIRTAEDLTYSNDNGPILLIVDRGITLIVPESPARLAQFIDIPLQHVTSISIRRTQVNTDSGHATDLAQNELMLGLSSEPWSYLLNAAEERADEIAIAMRDADVAAQAVAAIKSQQTPASQKVSTSQTLDVSKLPAPQSPEAQVEEPASELVPDSVPVETHPGHSPRHHSPEPAEARVEQREPTSDAIALVPSPTVPAAEVTVPRVTPSHSAASRTAAATPGTQRVRSEVLAPLPGAAITALRAARSHRAADIVTTATPSTKRARADAPATLPPVKRPKVSKRATAKYDSPPSEEASVYNMPISPATKKKPVSRGATKKGIAKPKPKSSSSTSSRRARKQAVRAAAKPKKPAMELDAVDVMDEDYRVHQAVSAPAVSSTKRTTRSTAAPTTTVGARKHRPAEPRRHSSGPRHETYEAFEEEVLALPADGELGGRLSASAAPAAAETAGPILNSAAKSPADAGESLDNAINIHSDPPAEDEFTDLSEPEEDQPPPAIVPQTVQPDQLRVPAPATASVKKVTRSASGRPLIDAERARKESIIAFDRRGPRNQGAGLAAVRSSSPLVERNRRVDVAAMEDRPIVDGLSDADAHQVDDAPIVADFEEMSHVHGPFTNRTTSPSPQQMLARRDDKIPPQHSTDREAKFANTVHTTSHTAPARMANPKVTSELMDVDEDLSEALGSMLRRPPKSHSNPTMTAKMVNITAPSKKATIVDLERAGRAIDPSEVKDNVENAVGGMFGVMSEAHKMVTTQALNPEAAIFHPSKNIHGINPLSADDNISKSLSSSLDEHSDVHNDQVAVARMVDVTAPRTNAALVDLSTAKQPTISFSIDPGLSQAFSRRLGGAAAHAAPTTATKIINVIAPTPKIVAEDLSGVNQAIQSLATVRKRDTTQRTASTPQTARRNSKKVRISPHMPEDVVCDMDTSGFANTVTAANKPHWDTPAPRSGSAHKVDRNGSPIPLIRTANNTPTGALDAFVETMEGVGGCTDLHEGATFSVYEDHGHAHLISPSPAGIHGSMSSPFKAYVAYDGNEVDEQDYRTVLRVRNPDIPTATTTTNSAMDTTITRTTSLNMNINMEPFPHVMSSNTKPLPQPPYAPSRAISGYASEYEVETVARRSAERRESDPFRGSSMGLGRGGMPGGETSFVKLLREKTGVHQMMQQEMAYNPNPRFESASAPAYYYPAPPTNTPEEHEMVGDATLVGAGEQSEGSYTTSSSTTAVSETAQAESMEWDSSLLAYQVEILELLSQITHGLISHVSATASAVDDHVSDYAQAGGALIGVMQSEHETERHAFMEAAMAQQAENGRVFVGLGMKLVARLAVFRRA
ncbi:hypothetical protein H2199_008884 [Coniosporium tulheliwenetii]|uniref:Uncharacterized protein n=1 Tax=Coniosporium tulheliwenetii TaxID=3383036 RepID=A0ACC2YHB0_9PEZI|nr:hypothetical protein H2199_008884 [Cladosporium sp. JES 115]